MSPEEKAERNLVSALNFDTIRLLSDGDLFWARYKIGEELDRRYHAAKTAQSQAAAQNTENP